MKILIVHNRYRPTAPSGENVVVDQESAALTASGSRRRPLPAAQRGDRHLVADARPRCRLASYGAATRGGPSRSRLAEFRPDVVHVHNTFPLVSPSVLYACRDAGVPVVATLHNYKLALRQR